MINFYYETEQESLEETGLRDWISLVIISEECKQGELNFILCDDDYLLKINQKYLNHDTYTDIISFDNSIGKQLHGDIYISSERVFDNAKKYKVSNDEEMRRVLIHGVLHLCGYGDKSEEETELMRAKENEKLEMFHVEQ